MQLINRWRKKKKSLKNWKRSKRKLNKVISNNLKNYRSISKLSFLGNKKQRKGSKKLRLNSNRRDESMKVSLFVTTKNLVMLGISFKHEDLFSLVMKMN